MKKQGEDEKEERWRDRQNPREEERAERSTESTIHTVPELLLDTMQVETYYPIDKHLFLLLLLLLCLAQTRIAFQDRYLAADNSVFLSVSFPQKNP